MEDLVQDSMFTGNILIHLIQKNFKMMKIFPFILGNVSQFNYLIDKLI